MPRWFYERTLGVRNHPVVVALGLLASIITIGAVIYPLINPPPQPPDGIVTGENRESLRETHGVRALSPLQEGLRISQLPNGVFGFTKHWLLIDPIRLQAADNITLGRTMAHGMIEALLNTAPLSTLQ